MTRKQKVFANFAISQSCASLNGVPFSYISFSSRILDISCAPLFSPYDAYEISEQAISAKRCNGAKWGNVTVGSTLRKLR